MKSTALTLTSEKYFERYAKFISEADGTPQRITSPDDLDNYGKLSTSIDNLEYYSNSIYEMGFQMNTHAIGDSTIGFLVKNYNKVLKNATDPRWRIEHSQVAIAT